MKGTMTMSAESSTTAAPSSSGAALEEVARRLARIHMPLATHLDGGRELQNWTRERIEDLMAYVDNAIDTQSEGGKGTGR
jgi:hypothetical protein